MKDGSLKDRSGEMIEGLKELGVEGLIGVGGDGSLEILRRLLAPAKLPFIGIPKTIDNDVANTERAVGHSTAIAVATEALDRLQPTGTSHDRVMVLGHVQRGAMPTAVDQLLASALGAHAVDILAQGAADRMVAWWNRQVIDVPLKTVAGPPPHEVDADGTLVNTAWALGICLGDMPGRQ